MPLISCLLVADRSFDASSLLHFNTTAADVPLHPRHPSFGFPAPPFVSTTFEQRSTVASAPMSFHPLPPKAVSLNDVAGDHPRLILCADGGGSKVMVVVRAADGTEVRGTSGPCNV